VKNFPDVFVVVRNRRRATPSNHLNYEDAKLEIYSLKSSLKTWSEPISNLNTMRIVKTKNPHHLL
jgi:hypothetical protein